MERTYTWNIPKTIEVYEEDCNEFLERVHDLINGFPPPSKPEVMWRNMAVWFIEEYTDYYEKDVPKEIIEQMGRGFRIAYTEWLAKNR